jgi:hypothetical protein
MDLQTGITKVLLFFHPIPFLEDLIPSSRFCFDPPLRIYPMRLWGNQNTVPFLPSVYWYSQYPFLK